ncbi:hypothetical protein PG994_015014 [Apiospora phragmitis]|uniref:Uncharacterized protein n=1 Tax=Apiospora phragmitis TaxID=2905665 RepID=A0ABR1SV98_9PEZI
MKGNFEQYGLKNLLGNCFVCDLTNSPVRKARFLDGILCDPPYGVREGLKVLGARDPVNQPWVVEKSKVMWKQPDYVPPKKPYSFVAMLDDILQFATETSRLTEDNPTLTTYFEGEVIGSKYNFITNHDSWGATEKIDLNHWNKFTAFRPYAKHARKGPVHIKDLHNKDNIFMRWKEHFLVPDHRVRTINGASFEGFYYICFNQREGGISGIYFHSRREK